MISHASNIALSSLPACWIALDCWTRDADPIQNHPVAFRFDLLLSSAPTDGTLEISTSNKYLLWVNGKLASSGPLRANPEHRFLDSIPLKEWLKVGLNQLAVIVLPPTGVTGYSWVTRTGLFCRGKVAHGNGGIAFWSSPDWRAIEAKWISSNGMLTSLPTGAQEHWDLELEPPNWTTENQGGWPPALPLGTAGTPPWTTLLPRPIPLLTHSLLHHQVVWSGQDDRIAGRRRENLAPQFTQKVVHHEPRPPAWTLPLTNDKANIYTFDVGKTRLVTPHIEILECSDTIQIELYYDIALFDRPHAMMGFETPREGFCDSLRPGKQKVRWRTLQPRGCRFITVRVAGQGAFRFNISFESTDYPFEDNVGFSSDNPEFSQYWEASKESLRSCSNDALVDTCARENTLWTFDACVAGKAAYFTFGDASLWRHSLWLIGNGIDDHGIPSAVVPSQPSFMILFDQTMQWVISCWEYYLCTEDADFGEDMFPAIARFLKKCHEHITDEGLFVPPNFSWHWVDWAPLDRRAYSLPVNAALIHSFRAATCLARHLRDEEFVDFAKGISLKLEQMVERFFDAERGLYRDHIPPRITLEPQNPFCPCPFEEIVSHSLHGNSRMATLQDATSRKTAALESMASWLAVPDAPVVHFGPGWTQILLQPLLEAGFVDEVTTFLSAKYGNQLATGSLTWTENFSPAKYNTAHAWGAAVNSLIVEGYLGIRPTSPGWRTMTISPRVPWEFVYEIETCLGGIGVEQSSEGLFVLVPEGAVAKVGEEVILGNGSWQKTAFLPEALGVLAH